MDIGRLFDAELGKCFICEGRYAASDIVYEDDGIIAFLDAFPSARRHVVVASRRHVTDSREIPLPTYLRLQTVLYRLEEIIAEIETPAKRFVFKSGGIVPHYRFHLVPVTDPDVLPGSVLVKKSHVEMLPGERADVARELRDTLAAKLAADT